MPDIAILREMIRDDARLPLVPRQGKNQVTLTEPREKGTVTITGLPDDSVVIKADAFRSPDSVFRGGRGECKRADYVIVAATGRKKILLCIEMKTTKDPEREIVRQLAGTRCFMAYCREIGKEFWQRRDFLQGYDYRFVSIGHLSIAKRRCRISRPAAIHDRPERMLKIDWPHHLQFNQLAGG